MLALAEKNVIFFKSITLNLNENFGYQIERR
uniref:Uncharacterized protein n=1 Tax=Anguilla anguilla TaxID=7936 RepID=A0A0E9V2F2_ANGAN